MALHLQRWTPFALSAYFVIIALFGSMMSSASGLTFGLSSGFPDLELGRKSLGPTTPLSQHPSR